MGGRYWHAGDHVLTRKGKLWSCHITSHTHPGFLLSLVRLPDLVLGEATLRPAAWNTPLPFAAFWSPFLFVRVLAIPAPRDKDAIVLEEEMFRSRAASALRGVL